MTDPRTDFEKEHEAHRFPVIWLTHVLRLTKYSKYTISLGYCAKTKKVAFISLHHPTKSNWTETIKPILVQDLFINKKCEDARHCWNLQCPYNETGTKAFKKYLGKKATYKDMKKMSQTLQEAGEKLSTEIKDWTKAGTYVYKKPIMYFGKDPKPKPD